MSEPKLTQLPVTPARQLERIEYQEFLTVYKALKELEAIVQSQEKRIAALEEAP